MPPRRALASGSVCVATAVSVAAPLRTAFAAVVLVGCVSACSRRPVAAIVVVPVSAVVPGPSVVPVMVMGSPVGRTIVPGPPVVLANVPAAQISTRGVARFGVVELSVDHHGRCEHRVSERGDTVRDDAAELVLESARELVACFGWEGWAEEHAQPQGQSRHESGCRRWVSVMRRERSRHGWFSPSASCAPES